MPVWLLGVALHRLQPRMSARVALVLFVASGAGALAYMHLGVNDRLMAWTAHWGLQAANNFAGDWLLGLLVAANFAAAANLPVLGRVLIRAKGQIRTAASYTFSIYLYHAPTFALLWGVLGWRQLWLVLPAMALIIVALGQCTERQLPRLRRLVEGRAWGTRVA